MAALLRAFLGCDPGLPPARLIVQRHVRCLPVPNVCECVCARRWARVRGRAIRYANYPLDRITANYTTQDTTTPEHRNRVLDELCSQCEPGIDFDEVHRHVVCVLLARGRHDRERNFVVAAFEVVASAYLPKLATVGGQSVAAAIVAANGMIVTVKTANERKRYCQQIQTNQALVD